MKNLKAKASSLPIFNGRISDSSTSSTSSIVQQVKNKKHATFSGYIPTVFSISNSNSSVSSLLKSDEENEIPDTAEAVTPKIIQESTKSINIIGPELNNYEKVKVVGQGGYLCMLY